MNSTETQVAIVERPRDRKWPYVLGGFIAGVASIIGAAYFFDDEGSGSSYNNSSHDSDALDCNDTEYVEDIQEEQSSLPLHVEDTEK